MPGFNFKNLVKSIYETTTTNTYPANSRSDRDVNFATALADVKVDLQDKLGVSLGTVGANTNNVLNVLPSNLKTAIEQGNMTFIGNGFTSPFWVINDRLMVFNGTSNGGSADTPKLQGDLAYEAFQLKAAEKEATSGNRSSDSTALNLAYNSKITSVYT